MRLMAFVLVLASCSSALAGQLFDSSQWADTQPVANGSQSFDDLVSLGPAEDGATIAYVDFFGTASSLSLYTGVHERADIRNVIAGETTDAAWLREVSTNATPQAIGDGWTRFDFRSLKLLSVPYGTSGPNFAGSRGPFFRIQDGSFSTVAGQEQHPFQEGGDVLYYELPGNIPSGPIPVLRVIWETLDSPYVSRSGDANRDGKIDLTDFGILKSHFGQSVDRWTVADFNGDGFVDSDDFGTLKLHFGESAPSTVPEPTSCVLAMLAALAALPRMSKRFSAVCFCRRR